MIYEGKTSKSSNSIGSVDENTSKSNNNSVEVKLISSQVLRQSVN